LFVLVPVGEPCVGDLALALDISMDQSSYALKQLPGAIAG
jgi:ArsR family transcriptional regulator, lead/cadmium/zinc/bismuth-responsive transcriptional repressor